MNVVKILLVLGLGYVAMTQKPGKTRNMLLVVTGLLALCMFSVEGFTEITFDDAASAVRGELSEAGTITTSGGRAYRFPVGFNVATGEGDVDYDCGTNEVKGDMVPNDSGPLSADTVADAFPCVSKQLCSAASTTTFTCSSGTRKSGDSDYCAGAACVDDDFGEAGTNCCAAAGGEEEEGDAGGPYLKDCGDKSCAPWNEAKDGEKCLNSMIPFMDRYCSTE